MDNGKYQAYSGDSYLQLNTICNKGDCGARLYSIERREGNVTKCFTQSKRCYRCSADWLWWDFVIPGAAGGTSLLPVILFFDVICLNLVWDRQMVRTISCQPFITFCPFQTTWRIRFVDFIPPVLWSSVTKMWAITKDIKQRRKWLQMWLFSLTWAHHFKAEIAFTIISQFYTLRRSRWWLDTGRLDPPHQLVWSIICRLVWNNRTTIQQSTNGSCRLLVPFRIPVSHWSPLSLVLHLQYTSTATVLSHQLDVI